MFVQLTFNSYSYPVCELPNEIFQICIDIFNIHLKLFNVKNSGMNFKIVECLF